MVYVLNGLYGPDGWFCANTVTLGLSELLGLDWYVCTLLYCQWDCRDQDCQDCQELSVRTHFRSLEHAAQEWIIMHILSSNCQDWHVNLYMHILYFVTL